MLDVGYECSEPVLRRKKEISNIEDELQCMESCLSQGFTLSDYIDTQKHLIEILKGLNEQGRR